MLYLTTVFVLLGYLQYNLYTCSDKDLIGLKNKLELSQKELEKGSRKTFQRFLLTSP